MLPQQVHGYLRNFFQQTDCPIIEDEGHYMTVQLTIEMDKRIMNRPFYWKYIESTDVVPCPAQLTLITNQNILNENVKGEIVHFGSYRLNQLFQATKEMGAYVQMFESIDTHESQTILTPFLCVNYKVSYFCDQTKEMLYSLGINLMTGNINEDFQVILAEVDLVSEMPDNAFPLQYIIKPIRALKRLDDFIENIIQQDDHTWAEKAKKRWQKDQRVLDYFYEEVEEKPESYEIEKKALEDRYGAKIKIEIINGGLFYLK
ncbi:YqhG family protein [Rummeliibacillus sp. NPDC094406]|uniref:YqhG family protein n=1 Tax=Rummeliibacillus sp. NPDC094406 TaxID=3364511 RepID=UPI00382FD643